jgi:hypothetical protein
MRMSTPTESTILVAGDVVIDHHLYEGERRDPGDRSKTPVRRVVENGGVWCLYRLLVQLFQGFAAEQDTDRKNAEHELEIAKLAWDYRHGLGRQSMQPKLREVKKEPEEVWHVVQGIVPPSQGTANAESYAVWRPLPLTRKIKPQDATPHELVWRTTSDLGYGGADDVDALITEPVQVAPRILVLDDASARFRLTDESRSWHLPETGEGGPEFIVLKTSAPLARGPLWERLSGTDGKAAAWLDRTVVILSANAIRSEFVDISRGLSWERTVEDLRDALFRHPALTALTRARHLVIAFSTEGVLWIARQGDHGLSTWKARLFFDAACGEEESRETFEGHAYGYLTCLTAAIVRGLVRNLAQTPGECDLNRAIQSGLSAMRDLDQKGHGTLADPDSPSGFPAARLAKVIRTENFPWQSSPVPWLPPEDVKDRGSWSIVEMSQHPLNTNRTPSGLTGLARQVVLRGTRAIQSLPHARFRKFVTVDRREIETLRHIRRLMWNYRDDQTATKPLSIGVFGPPGAGKSFAVRQLADEVFADTAWMEFNLSQFVGPNDFIGALHQVRDRVLGGITPVVFWDEFDAQEFVWLQYLLAPMQDGKFQEGQITHPVGKGVFIVAGGTSRTYKAFGAKRPDENADRIFRLRKGPDFHSRLDAYYDVLGPNQRTITPDGAAPSDTDLPDSSDISVPLRRGIFITAHLPVPKDKALDIDSGLVTALLEIPNYIHGARSLEKILSSLKSPSADAPIRRSALPGPDVLTMHVHPADQFTALMRYEDDVFAPLDVDVIAAAIHDDYLQMVDHQPPNPAFREDFQNLSEEGQASNRAAARRIPGILALVGLKIVEGHGGEDLRQRVREHLEHHLELLAEAEHIGWMTERRNVGYRYGEKRDNALRVHNLLVPYDDLPRSEQQKDRNAILRYPDVLGRAGYHIAFPGSYSNPRK